MGLKKPKTYLEQLKELQRQYISLEYRLNKLIEAESGKHEKSIYDLISVKQAADILGCSTRTVYRIAKQQHIYKVTYGNHKVLYKKDDIERIAVLRG